ncbi:hypothetical protein BCR43DRAFT_468194 [Syncephalastrum racemosum]|uniref:HCP-like protein n=1 Tax=Syncephalastrum racemosum TaxID=13706 RepID=A0A1X2HL84_SYNRA|nr:hypothetical protein BCR43DRAFT_468194 [Syncephalastrum racemosum]
MLKRVLPVDDSDKKSDPGSMTVVSPAQKTVDERQQAAIDQHVQKGIEFHELGQLEKATHHFRLAAKDESPVGMFLYGISLRHGWGCKLNTALAFQYLQKAAEHAIDGLQQKDDHSVEKMKDEYDALLASRKGELIMAIYELGVSFQQGWGVSRSRETAFYYFQIAAQLGDPDAQNEVAQCYYTGQGVKKDVRLAAQYYRKAAAQGRGIMGNSWIFKSKYD